MILVPGECILPQKPDPSALGNAKIDKYSHASIFDFDRHKKVEFFPTIVVERKCQS